MVLSFWKWSICVAFVVLVLKGSSLSADEPKTPAKPDAPPAKTEPAKTEPAKTEPAKTEPAKTEPAKTEPAKTEPAKTEPAKTEPAKTESAKTDAKSPAASTAKSQAFAEKLQAWKNVIKELRGLRRKFEVADEAEVVDLRKRYAELLAKGNELAPQAKAAALEAYLENPNADHEVTRFLVKFVSDAVERDDYDAAYNLAKTLLDNKCFEPELPVQAALASFGVGDFEQSSKLWQDVKKSGVAENLDNGKLSSVTDYIKFWADEKAIREKEAKADDLPRVKIETTKGTLVVELFENEAPKTVANFVFLVQKGFYNGTTFHRVLPGFMAQGGDPQGDGKGGPGWQIEDELDPATYRKHFRGSLSMANSGPNTAGSQFFITFLPTPHLNGKHTVFGRVIEGFDVLAKLQRRDPDDRKRQPPPEPDKIVKAEVLRKRGHEYVPVKNKAE